MKFRRLTHYAPDFVGRTTLSLTYLTGLKVIYLREEYAIMVEEVAELTNARKHIVIKLKERLRQHSKHGKDFIQ